MSGLQLHELLAPEQVTVTSGFDGTTQVDLLHPGWAAIGLVALSVPVKIVENRPNVGGIGSTELDSAVDELRATLKFHVVGEVDESGDPVIGGDTALRVQFRRNWLYLCKHLFMPTQALDAVYTSPDPGESPISFKIQFGTPSLDPENGMWPTDWLGQVQVVLPGGPLVPA